MHYLVYLPQTLRTYRDGKEVTVSTNHTIDTAKAADLLGVSRTTAIRMVHRGELKGYKLTSAKNSPIRVYRDSVIKFMKKQGRQLPEAVPAHEEG